jgi:hypothetical protein
MVFLLVFLAFLAVISQRRMSERWEPHYYVDVTDQGINPLQEAYRISYRRSRDLRRIVVVDCYLDGSPFKIERRVDGRPVARRWLLMDGYGRLRYEAVDGPWGPRLRRLSPQPAAPSE